jgi:hypothetical protein
MSISPKVGRITSAPPKVGWDACIYHIYTYPATTLDATDATCKGDSAWEEALVGSDWPLGHKSAPPKVGRITSGPPKVGQDAYIYHITSQ